MSLSAKSLATDNLEDRLYKLGKGLGLDSTWDTLDVALTVAVNSPSI